MGKMYKLYVKQTHKYINVSLDKHIEIESPWVPRTSEYFYSMGLKGNIQRVQNTYINEPQVDLILEDEQEDKVFHSSDLLGIEDYIVIFAYVEGTEHWDKTLVYQKKTPREVGQEFDKEAFDKQFLPKEKKGFFSR